MAEETLLDLILQIVILVLIGAAFFLAVRNATDTNLFFLRYDAKDTGTIVETLHAAKGDVDLLYGRTNPDKKFVFGFTRAAVLLAPENKSANPQWRVRQQYGQVLADKPSLSVVETTLAAPDAIEFSKSGPTISFARTLVACPDARATLLRRDTKLVLDAPEPMRSKLNDAPLIKSLSATTLPKQAITFTIKRAGTTASLSAYASDDPVASQRLVCLLSSRLAETFPTLTTTQETARREGIVVDLQLPEQLKGSEETGAIQAILLTLDEYTKS